MILDFLLLFSFHDFGKFVGPRSDWLTLSNHIKSLVAVNFKLENCCFTSSSSAPPLIENYDYVQEPKSSYKN